MAAQRRTASTSSSSSSGSTAASCRGVSCARRLPMSSSAAAAGKVGAGQSQGLRQGLAASPARHGAFQHAISRMNSALTCWTQACHNNSIEHIRCPTALTPRLAWCRPDTSCSRYASAVAWITSHCCGLQPTSSEETRHCASQPSCSASQRIRRPGSCCAALRLPARAPAGLSCRTGDANCASAGSR